MTETPAASVLDAKPVAPTLDGVLVVMKQGDWTSHDVVAKMRSIARTKKIGHLGTLDPMATGVLPLVVGRATRLAQFYTKSTKAYDGIVRFGFSTNTYDAEGEPASEPRTPEFTQSELEAWLAEFRGTIWQKPPAVSAKKINGTPAYKLARKNIDVDIPAVEVTITELAITSFALPEVRLHIECSSGTYVRSIAHDLGQRAGCGAHLTALVRTRSGDFHLDAARTLDQMQSLASTGRLVEALIPLEQMLPQFPVERVDDLTASQIRHGREFRVSPFRPQAAAPFVKAVGTDGRLVGIGEQTMPNVYHPMLVL